MNRNVQHLEHAVKANYYPIPRNTVKYTGSTFLNNNVISAHPRGNLAASGFGN